MAIVADAAVGGAPVDKSYTSYNRTNAGEPNGTLTPQFVGEIVLDTTNNTVWKSLGVANNTWIALAPF